MKGEEDLDARPAADSLPCPTRQATSKRTVCDHCRRRRIRCDGQSPCQQCSNAALGCKREHVPKKRGPKRGHGRVIDELRARDAQRKEGGSRESSMDNPASTGADEGLSSVSNSMPSTPPDISWNKIESDPRNAPEPGGVFASEQFRPTSRSYLHLIPACADLYYEHIYPIMPLPYMPAVRDMIRRPMTDSEKNFIYALCALTSFHMSGQSIPTTRSPSWEVVGRFFLDECISVRQSYDFLEDASLNAVVSSFWLSTSFFEINQSRKSWLYLREALTLALDLGIQDDSTYVGLAPEEKLCRQRVFWQLFVTERSFAILRNKPITFKKTPSLPTTKHAYEAPDIHSGFLKLISSYAPLDESFVTAWNDGSDPRVSATTYLALQNVLSVPPSFLSRSGASTPSTVSTKSYFGPSTSTGPTSVPDPASDDADADADASGPTAIQKADLLITQQWLRLIVWQSSFRQGLLTWSAAHESMQFAFPLAIARRTVAVLQSLPSSAVEVHGMGIFEKIFEIGTWCINVLGACDAAVGAGTPIGGLGMGPGLGGGGIMGMDFVGSSDFGVLGVGRKEFAIDPLEFFVRTLSASPNSQTRFAERLLMFAKDRPGGMTMALSPALSTPSTPGFPPSDALWDAPPGGAAARAGPAGTVLGEVTDETADDERRFGMSGALLDVSADGLPKLDDLDTMFAGDEADFLSGSSLAGQAFDETLGGPATAWNDNDAVQNFVLGNGAFLATENGQYGTARSASGHGTTGMYQDESTPRNWAIGTGGNRHREIDPRARGFVGTPPTPPF